MKKAFVLIAALLFISRAVIAQIPEAQKGTYVNDFANVLTKDEVTNLNKEIFDIEKQANVQMAIVLVKKVPADYNIKTFAVEIGKKWQVGKNQNGFVYVVAIDQHQQRIEVARNLTQFPVAKCAEIMTAVKPYYQSENYGEGLQILVDKVKAELQVETTQTAAAAPAPAAPTDPAAYQTTRDVNPQDNTLSNVVGFVIVIAVVITVIVYTSRRNRKQREMANFYNGNANYNVPNQGYTNQGYPNAGYTNQPDHMLRDLATGAIIGAAVGYAADSLLNDLGNQNIDGQDYQDTTNTNQSYDPGTQTDQTSNEDDNNSSNWGNWGDSGGSDSSFDSGFSDSSDFSGGSSDW